MRVGFALPFTADVGARWVNKRDLADRSFPGARRTFGDRACRPSPAVAVRAAPR
jgi:hypothetical protein